MINKKFQRLVLHFGGDKTGSTSIQECLNNARDILLSEAGIAYPPWHTAQLGSYFCEEPETYIYNKEYGLTNRETIQKNDLIFFTNLTNWLTSIPETSTVVFSYEGFPSIGEYSLNQFAEYCKQLAEVVDVIFYVREPLSYAVSAMSQMIKGGRLPFSKNQIPIASYKNQIEDMAKAFGKERLTIKTFSPKLLLNGDVVSDFFRIIGIKSPENYRKFTSKKNRENKSLSMPAMRIGEAMITTMTQYGMRWNVIEFYTKYGQYLSTIPGDSIYLTTGQAQLILEHAKVHMDYLSENFGIKLEENPNQYLEPSNDNNKSPEHLLKSIGEAFGKILSPQPIIDGRGKIEFIGKNTKAPTPGEQWCIPIILLNNSEHAWRSLPNMPFYISYHWFNSAGKLVVRDGVRTPFPFEQLEAGEHITVDIAVKAPEQPGHYRLQVLPVQENHAWLDQFGFTPGTLEVEVVANYT